MTIKLSRLFWAHLVWIWLIGSNVAFAGSFSTGAIDTVARANAATAQSTANAAEPTASLPNYLASPPPIGTTTPAPGKFTSLNATSGTLGNYNIGTGVFNGIVNGALIDSTAIGGSVPASGAFTTLSANNEAGTIFSFAGTSCPAHSLLVPTTPTTVYRGNFSTLFAAIGTTWGAGDGSTTFGLPWIPGDYSTVQANANVGSTTVGAVIAHSHQWSAFGGGSNTSEVGIAYGNGVFAETVTTSTSGGSSNLAAGVRILNCIKY